MLLVMVGVLLIVLVIGLITKYAVAAFCEDVYVISWREYGLTAAVITLFVVPLTVWGGYKLGVNDKLTFKEYWNGWETKPTMVVQTCTEDGSCRHCFDCDPYTVYVECDCDKDGHCSTCAETRYHSCPYTTQEWSFYVETTVGRQVISEDRFPENYQIFRSDEGEHENVPSNLLAEYGTGYPKFWLAVKARIDSGFPGPVVIKKEYPNYILASDFNIYGKYAGDIDDYKAAHLLPSPVVEFHDYYYTDKVSFIGIKPHDQFVWQSRLSYLNADIGHDFQGDMRIVVIKNDKVNLNPDKYTNSLQAYWQSWAIWKKDALAKNSVVVVIGAGDSTILWSRAFTGMPVGNELLKVQLSEGLTNSPLTADRAIGIIKSDLHYQFSTSGGIGKTVLDSTPTRFKRAHMKDFAYLKGEIEPTDGAIHWTFFLAVVLGALCWIAPVVIDDGSGNTRRFRSSYHSY